MKFSQSLKYNSVPEWKDKYMDYAELKKLVYTLQSEELKLERGNQGENIINVDRNKKLAILKNKILFMNKKTGDSTKNGGNVDVVSLEDFPAQGESSGGNNTDNVQIAPTLNNSDEYNYEETYELQNINNNADPSSSSTPGLEQQQANYQEEKNNDVTNVNAITKNINSKTKNLKIKNIKNIKNIFSDKNELASGSSSTHSGSSSEEEFNPEKIFMDALYVEREKVDDFYKEKESELYQSFDLLWSDIENANANFTSPDANSLSERRLSLLSEAGNTHILKKQTTLSRVSSTGRTVNPFDEDEDDEELEEEDLEHGRANSSRGTALLNHTDFTIKSQKRAILKKKIIDLYVDLVQLKSFIELNKIGFFKITKKFDKTLNCHTRPQYIESGDFFRDTFVFQLDTIEELDTKIAAITEFYAMITNQLNDLQECREELRSYLRDYIVWERNSVWKDILGLESHKPDANGDISELESGNDLKLDCFKFPLPHPINLRFTKIERILIPKLFFTMKAVKIGIIFIFTAVLLGVKTFNDPVHHRCIALIECVALLWATEALPLFVTAMLVPFMAVLLRVYKNSDGTTMDYSDAATTVFAAMWSSTIMVLLAGFTMGAALSKYNVAKIAASYLLNFAGTKPRNVLLMIMSVVFFLSMWISNVASPVLTYSLAQPLLRTLDADSPFAKALVIGVALSADIGGMASPISSPQNVISMEYLKPYGVGWGQFFSVALPTGIFAMLLVWIECCLTFKINKDKIFRFQPIRQRFTMKQYFVIFVTLGTILLWCFLTDLPIFGNAGVIGCLPICLLFGSGMLSVSDLNSFPWTIVILAMGGIALGSGVKSSGLLDLIGRSLEKRIVDYPLYAILCIFGIIMLVFGTFVSHTVSAIIIVPLVQEVGDQLSNPKAAPILVFGCSLLASCGMGLASSGFPNVTAVSMTDHRGKYYLNTNSFITRGVPASLLAFIAVITLGFGIMNSVLKGGSSS
ncbi:related to Inorganic phosphate transporter PHO87 [Saccharomycodes ludwigii]|uniref:Related to Inorganic phosphate transporter PHO87 n=1 Tax=Saccharomycodes ludwigii TaxID=36035 RepID=A0A376BB73_9ASCO|nr:hypothetical protein SCDLUD_004037 [Saccharomycodes ludwigii]KAH3899751.1 hypothetical protein SCDLUD_004037 [Saccharomycodes ludwigii]SSD61938.1 related to Inorganic phosphate transporter PHO87 [Saccharomycodes ludwigii]